MQIFNFNITVNIMVLIGIIGWQEIIAILLILLLITGGSFIPAMMRKFGKNVKEFDEATKDSDERIKDTITDILKKHGK